MKNKYLLEAKRVFQLEIAALNFVYNNLDDNLGKAIDKILKSDGKVIICGIGKSGYVAQKISSTLISTGTLSVFLHPSEAIHGDLGIIERGDIFLAISYSGETEELIRLIPFVRDNGNTLISMTGNPLSTLAKYADINLNINVEREACVHLLAPTSSTTASLVLGDAIAISLMKAKNFQPKDFAKFHPGGSLGRKLLRVRDRMIVAASVQSSSSLRDVIVQMSKANGIICVKEGIYLVGIITDGDLRRTLDIFEFDKLGMLQAKDVMTTSPKTIDSSILAINADEEMFKLGINSLIINENEVYVYHNMNGLKS